MAAAHRVIYDNAVSSHPVRAFQRQPGFFPVTEEHVAPTCSHEPPGLRILNHSCGTRELAEGVAGQPSPSSLPLRTVLSSWPVSYGFHFPPGTVFCLTGRAVTRSSPQCQDASVAVSAERLGVFSCSSQLPVCAGLLPPNKAPALTHPISTC